MDVGYERHDMSKPTATLVTGGSNGIGKAIIESRMGLADTVLNVDLEPPLGETNARFFEADLSSREQLHHVLEEITATYDVTRVVNCAGVALLSHIEAFDEDDFFKTMELNVFAPAVIVNAVLPAMKRVQFGRIVNIASRAALGKGLRTSYASSKGALISATRVWALELGRYGITANAIGPGPIETELYRKANPPESEVTKRAIQDVPVGRLGQPEDVAAAANFFLSDEAGYVTGQTLFVCGGLTIGIAGA